MRLQDVASQVILVTHRAYKSRARTGYWSCACGASDVDFSSCLLKSLMLLNLPCEQRES